MVTAEVKYHEIFVDVTPGNVRPYKSHRAREIRIRKDIRHWICMGSYHMDIWKIGRLEDRKIGRSEDWKIRRLEVCMIS